MTKKKWTIYAGIVVLLVVSVFILKSCKAYDQTSILKGEIAAMKVAQGKLVAAHLKEIAGKDASIAEKDKMLVLKAKDVARKEGLIGDLSSERDRLKAEYLLLTDLPAKVRNLELQVGALEQTVYQYQGLVADKDDQINIWRGKFDAEKVIAANYRVLWEGEKALGETRDDLNKRLSRKIAFKKLTGTVKTVAIIGAVAYIFIKK